VIAYVTEQQHRTHLQVLDTTYTTVRHEIWLGWFHAPRSTAKLHVKGLSDM